jgi:glycosyltransferase involved in cell wall biosynthesis
LIYSLIIPHFNDSDRLVRLLKSVPVEREDIEVIVVDDCTPKQESLDSIRNCWPMVLWLSTPQNSGAGAARNVGMDAATGRWLLFADSDDEFMPSAFDTFDRELRFEDEIVYFLAESVQEIDGSPSLRSEGMNELVEAYALSLSSESLQNLKLHHVVPWAKVYSKAFVQARKLRFYTTFLGNDVAFNVLGAVQAERVRALTRVVYRAYQRPKSLTTDVSAEAFMNRFLVILSVAQRLADLGLKHKMSGTGQMLLSVLYGPRIAFRVWYLTIFSPMKIEWLRIFDIGRWRRFITRERRSKAEQKKFN